ncbi:MAG: DUF1080 domain-containing protein [Gemmatimonadales bacterium]|nr:DUF1080 domain-containing protein [Gemmatimonadales bacterium]
MNARILCWLVSGTLVAALACARGEADPCSGANALSDTEQAEGWTLLFDGESLAGWHGYNGGALESWTIEDCAIKSLGTEGNYGSDLRTDLVSDVEYTNFEFSIDWKITEGGNSGIMYGVIEDEKYDAAWQTGPEYQLVDDVGFGSELRDVNKTAADYDMRAAAEDKPLRPVGEWNTSRIVVNGNRVEHWLNGVKVLEFERWNDEWESLKNASKWGEYPDYGTAATGHIVIQDHGSVFWFRNVKIREITQG